MHLPSYMKELFIIKALMIVCHFSLAQPKPSFDKWKNCIVNLEMRGRDTTGYFRYDSSFRVLKDSLRNAYKNGSINLDTYSNRLLNYMRNSPRSKTKYSTGSAVFIKSGGKRYLITARHVVHDTSEVLYQQYYNRIANNEIIFSEIFIRPRYKTKEAGSSNKKNKIVTGIVSIKGETNGTNQFKKKDSSSTYKEEITSTELFGVTAFGVIMNTPENCMPYTLSDSKYDLAILSLDNKSAFFGGPPEFSNLGDYLTDNGYVPIELSDIDESEIFEGEEVFAIGFPGSTSTINQIVKTNNEVVFSPYANSLPVFAFGKVAMTHKELEYFWIDASVYPGNSGGPVIRNGKLLGLVSAQATVNSIRIPFGRIIKSKYIVELLQKQAKKDACK